MSATLLTPPQIEPVSLSEMKAYLKIEHADEDDLLRAFVTSARIHLEQMLGLQFIAQTWRVVIDGPFSSSFLVPVSPLSNILDAALISPEGDVAVLGREAFAIEREQGPARIRNQTGVVLFSGQKLQLDVEVGFGATADDVPATLRQAIKMRNGMSGD